MLSVGATTALLAASTAAMSPVAKADVQHRDVTRARALLAEAEANGSGISGALAKFDEATSDAQQSYADVILNPEAMTDVLPHLGEEGHADFTGNGVTVKSVDDSRRETTPSLSGYANVQIHRTEGLSVAGIPIAEGNHYHTFIPSQLKNLKCVGSYNGVTYGFSVKTSSHQWSDGKTHCEIHFTVEGSGTLHLKTHSWGFKTGTWNYERGTF